MAKVMKECRVCGKKYEACHTPNTSGVFRWRDVACSIECGRIYLERIEQSRQPVADVAQDVSPDIETQSAPAQDEAEAIVLADGEEATDSPDNAENAKERRITKKEKAAL